MKDWRSQERYIAHKVDGKRVVMSGAGRSKGDVTTDGWRIECKFTTKSHFTLTVAMLDKLAVESLRHGCSCALVVTFQSGRFHNTIIFILEERGEFMPDWKSLRIRAEHYPQTVVSRHGLWIAYTEHDGLACIKGDVPDDAAGMLPEAT